MMILLKTRRGARYPFCSAHLSHIFIYFLHIGHNRKTICVSKLSRSMFRITAIYSLLLGILNICLSVELASWQLAQSNAGYGWGSPGTHFTITGIRLSSLWACPEAKRVMHLISLMSSYLHACRCDGGCSISHLTVRSGEVKPPAFFMDHGSGWQLFVYSSCR